MSHSRPPGRRAAAPSRRASRRPSSRPAGNRGNRGCETQKTGTARESADLLGVTAERLQCALSRSFLRYSIPGDLDAAVHAAMNVIGPVLEARDTEIRRLHRLIAAKIPAR